MKLKNLNFKCSFNSNEYLTHSTLLNFFTIEGKGIKRIITLKA